LPQGHIADDGENEPHELGALNGISKEGLMAMTRARDDCLIWTGYHYPDGYGGIFLHGKRRRVHRVSYELHKGPIPPGMMVLHACDVRDCCNPDHLSLGTAADNAADMVARNRQAKGKQNGRTRLSEEDVIAIRRAYRPRSPTRGNAALARQYGVSPATISYVVSHRHWTHINAVKPIH
jgi:hypothetical protein